MRAERDLTHLMITRAAMMPEPDAAKRIQRELEAILYGRAHSPSEPFSPARSNMPLSAEQFQDWVNGAL